MWASALYVLEGSLSTMHLGMLIRNTAFCGSMTGVFGKGSLKGRGHFLLVMDLDSSQCISLNPFEISLKGRNQEISMVHGR